MEMDYKDLAERVGWTFVAAAIPVVTAAPALNLDVAKQALIVGGVAAADAVLVVARTYLPFLKTPGTKA